MDCPNCGNHRKSILQTLCSSCGHQLKEEQSTDIVEIAAAAYLKPPVDKMLRYPGRGK